MKTNTRTVQNVTNKSRLRRRREVDTRLDRMEFQKDKQGWETPNGGGGHPGVPPAESQCPPPPQHLGTQSTIAVSLGLIILGPLPSFRREIARQKNRIGRMALLGPEPDKEHSLRIENLLNLLEHGWFWVQGKGIRELLGKWCWILEDFNMITFNLRVGTLLRSDFSDYSLRKEELTNVQLEHLVDC
ncbi:hypothetical protein J6590_004346 [Homalodisca vitripennis]|nr:hypothetical protein J6590_004346 [Homalodisca vitripennis]